MGYDGILDFIAIDEDLLYQKPILGQAPSNDKIRLAILLGSILSNNFCRLLQLQLYII